MCEITPEKLMLEADGLYAYAMQRVGDHHHAEDLVQVCLVTAWQKRDTFGGRSKLSTWLFGIMKFKILDLYRERKRTPTNQTMEASDEEWGSDPFNNLFDSHGSWKVDPNYGLSALNESPEELAHRQDIMEWIRLCAERMPDRLKLLFNLREIDELPVSEVAAAAGVTPGSAGVLLTRARHQMRACLQHHKIAL